MEIMRTQSQDMTELRRTWKRRNQRVEKAKSRINTSGMTRPRRTAIERRWLERTGTPGPFVEVSS